MRHGLRRLLPAAYVIVVGALVIAGSIWAWREVTHGDEDDGLPDTSITSAQASGQVDRLAREMISLPQPKIQWLNVNTPEPIALNECSAGSLTYRPTGQVRALASYRTPDALPETTSHAYVDAFRQHAASKGWQEGTRPGLHDVTWRFAIDEMYTVSIAEYEMPPVDAVNGDVQASLDRLQPNRRRIMRPGRFIQQPVGHP